MNIWKSAAFLIVSLLLSSGCADMKLHDVQPRELPDQPARQQVQPKTPTYMDFSDILIPAELSKDTPEGYLVNGYGRMVVRGRVDGDSIEKFFANTMSSGGWTFLDEYRFQGNIMMYFAKQDKISSILISENPMDTKVEIWVTPTKKR